MDLDIKKNNDLSLSDKINPKRNQANSINLQFNQKNMTYELDNAKLDLKNEILKKLELI